MKHDATTEVVLAAAIDVHRALGPGLLESSYEACLCHELRTKGVRHDRQVRLPIIYKGLKLDDAYRLDIVVDDCVVVELKSVESVLPIHTAQLLTYLRHSAKDVGLLLNFNEPVLRDGVTRLVL